MGTVSLIKEGGVNITIKSLNHDAWEFNGAKT